MVNATCAVYGCTSTSYNSKQLIFHLFPITEERCQLWLQACKRSDLQDRDYTLLKYKHICSLHFEKNMYGKKNLKKTAIPTKKLPSTPTRSIGVQTKAPKIIILQSSRSMLTDPGTSSGPERFESEKPLTDDHALQTLAKLTDHTPRKRKLCTLLHHSASQVRKHNKAYEDNRHDSTIEQFLIGCDTFLKPNFSTIVKAQLREDSMLAADSPFSTHSPLPRTSISSDETMKKNLSSDEERKVIIDEVLKAIKDEDEFDGIGMIVASKLRRMDEDQRIYAEVLTNSILIHGIKKGLQNETSLTGLKYT